MIRWRPGAGGNRGRCPGPDCHRVVGFGQQYGDGSPANAAGSSAALLPKVRVDIVIPDEFVDAVVSVIAKCASTGSAGGG